MADGLKVKKSYVVTGGGRGIGRAVAERLAEDGHVVVIDADPDALAWTNEHAGLSGVVGDAGDEDLASAAADAAESVVPLAGWVNNAAVFRDASLHEVPAHDVLQLITLNLALAVTGCATAVRRFLAAGSPGGDRQRLLAPGSATCPRRAALRHGQGGDRGPRRERSPSTTDRPGSARMQWRWDRLRRVATRLCSTSGRRSRGRSPACIRWAARA